MISLPRPQAHGRRLLVPIRSEDVKRLALLFVPTTLLLGVGRLLEYSTLGGQGRMDLAVVLWCNLPVPALVVFVSIVAWIVARKVRGFSPFTASGIALLSGVGVAVLAWRYLPWWITAWLDPAIASYLRTDVFLVLCIVGGIGLAFGLLGRWHTGRILVIVLSHTSAMVIATVALVDVAVLMGTGAHGGYFALRDFVSNPIQLGPVVASELSPGQLALLTLPLVIGLSPWLGRRTYSYSQEQAPLAPLSVYGGIAPLLFFMVLLPGPHEGTNAEGAVIRMASMAWADLGREDTFDVNYTATSNPFDLRGTRMARTDSTRSLNVVVLLLESVRASALTPYAPHLPTTPFLDSIAKRGLVAERMFAGTPYTNKSIVTAFAGIPPSLSPDIVEALPGAIPARGLAGMLGELGYRSAFFTPATLAFERKDLILKNLGFEEYYGDGAYPTEGFQKKVYFGYEDRVMLSHLSDWVDQAVADSTPFFVGGLTLTSHHPYDVPSNFPKGKWETGNDHLDAYYDAVRYTDDFVQELFEAFESRGLMESTLFVVLGDHGEAFDEHGQRTHGDIIWDEALQIPAILYNPVLFSEGQRVKGERHMMDIVPTIADALGLHWQGQLPPGHSLLREVPDGRPLFHSTKNGRSAIALRQSELKFIYHYRRRPTQAFAVQEDPGERVNIANRLEPAALQAAEEQIYAWQNAVTHAYGLAREGKDWNREEAPPSGRLHYAEKDGGRREEIDLAL